jgi:hypothetical protein
LLFIWNCFDSGTTVERQWNEMAMMRPILEEGENSSVRLMKATVLLCVGCGHMTGRNFVIRIREKFRDRLDSVKGVNLVKPVICWMCNGREGAIPNAGMVHPSDLKERYAGILAMAERVLGGECVFKPYYTEQEAELACQPGGWARMVGRPKDQVLGWDSVQWPCAYLHSEDLLAVGWEFGRLEGDAFESAPNDFLAAGEAGMELLFQQRTQSLEKWTEYVTATEQVVATKHGVQVTGTDKR